MARLSDSLVKQFVKMTNDTTKKKSESFLYGTVDSIGEDGTANVIFDGAADSTPCASSVSIAVGDRVLVMLKNRQATITSNVSNPTVNAEYLEAGEAKISGTIHAATYEDSTGNFTMDIGATEDAGGHMVPAFKIGGYLNGDPNNKYYEVVIGLYPPTKGIDPIPNLWIEGSLRDNPEDIYDNHANIGVDETGLHFNGSYHEISGGKRYMHRFYSDYGWQGMKTEEEDI